MPIIQAIRVSETPLKLLRDGAYYLKEAYRAFLRVARERPGFDLPRPWARKHPRSQVCASNSCACDVSGSRIPFVSIACVTMDF